MLDVGVPISATFLVIVGLKILMLLIESRGKTNYLKPDYQSLPPEATSGIINRSLLWWLNDVFKTGSKGIISQGDLFELDPKLASENAGRNMRDAWENRRMYLVEKR
jgi:ATP-binding cassette subfamily C (CFTR/MRP) protein 1